MLRLERLRADHARALLEFERENRAYFARTVSDRGDAYFTDFAARHRALLDEQDTGACHFHVVMADQDDLVGRVNLVDVAHGSAELGYRIAERASGRGVASEAVTRLCRLAAADYALVELRARTTLDNPASMMILARTGFEAVADTTIGSRPGVWYRRQLAP
ncbi:GNAT family N-acetyltransferase [Streptomyces sp. NPDC048664]|uniref:GNAT family N-acetyltransferase n=1 Tax=Streptomyces sp. NPDC048664 TaxID=3154505 RepID=UPI003426BE21